MFVVSGGLFLVSGVGLLGCAGSPPRSDVSERKRAMSTSPIVQAGTPVLRDRAAEVPPERIATPEIQALIQIMIATMRAAPGVGLAAPQIGVGLRIFVLEDRPELIAHLGAAEIAERGRIAFPVRVFVNPVLRPVGEERAGYFEGCLSVNGYTAYVERYAEVEVSGLDEHGVSQTWRARGWPARILQHEHDHLDGMLYIDRMNTRSFATAELARSRYAGKSALELRQLLGLPAQP
jgi:peptide deformylase